jgi:hypothetical protein
MEMRQGALDAFDEAGDLVELGNRKRKGHLKSAPHRSIEQFGMVRC